MKKLLMTGATGMIGNALGQRLVQEGYEIHVLTRDPKRAAVWQAYPAKFFAWDSQQSQTDPAAFEGVQTIIHLAGEPVAGRRWSAERKKQILESRVKGTQNLLTAYKKSGSSSLKTVISASAIGFYGDRGDEILTEQSPAGSGYLADVCQKWENALFENLPQGARGAAIRIGVVLSKRGGALAELIPIFEKGLGGPIGSGKQWMSWIDLEDLVCLFLEAVKDSAYSGVFNGVAPNPVQNIEFAKKLGTALGKPAWIKTPRVALEVALGEMSQVILASQKVSAHQVLAQGFKFKFSKLEEAFAANFGELLQKGEQEFFAEQWIPKKVEEVFPFFSEAKNLEQLTPPWLKFEVLRKSTPEIQEGTLIDYQLKIKGFPAKWQSRIEEWVPNQKFVDIQVKGPYAKWHHTHQFIPMAGGTLLRDRVIFKVPMGILGQMAVGKLIQNDVRSIFEYRRKAIWERFGV